MHPTKRKTADRIYEYADLVQLMNDNHLKAMNFTFGPPPMVGVTFGSRYAKVVKQALKVTGLVNQVEALPRIG